MVFLLSLYFTAFLYIFPQHLCKDLICFFWGGCLFAFSRATPAAYGSSRARGGIRATATGLHHSHSHARSKARLQPTPQLTAMPDPEPTEQGQGLNPNPHGS